MSTKIHEGIGAVKVRLSGGTTWKEYEIIQDLSISGEAGDKEEITGGETLEPYYTFAKDPKIKISTTALGWDAGDFSDPGEITNAMVRVKIGGLYGSTETGDEPICFFSGKADIETSVTAGKREAASLKLEITVYPSDTTSGVPGSPKLLKSISASDYALASYPA